MGVRPCRYFTPKIESFIKFSLRVRKEVGKPVSFKLSWSVFFCIQHVNEASEKFFFANEYQRNHIDKLTNNRFRR